MRRSLFWVVAVGFVLLTLGTATTTLAHEIITVGPYRLEVGWLDEPALVGEKNAIQVSIFNSEANTPVENISTIQSFISIGGRNKEVLLRSLAEDKPGQYVADLIPTVRGVYTLELKGSLGDERLDVSIDLDEVETTNDLQFPEPAPSTIELQQHLAAAETALAFTRRITYVALAGSLLAVVVSFVRWKTKRN